MTSELLSSLHKSEALLRKMGKKGQANNSTNMSDMDKIYIQLYLDSEAYGAQIESFGVVQLTSIDSYNKLKQCVSNKNREQNE